MLVSASCVAAHESALRFLRSSLTSPSVQIVPMPASCGLDRRAEQLAPEAAAVAAHELDLLREHAAHAERGADARAELLVELVRGIDHAPRLPLEARALVAEQAVELVADELEATIARERDADRRLRHHRAHLDEQLLPRRLARLALAHDVLQHPRELAELAAEVRPAGLDVGILGDQLQRALLQPLHRSQQVERDQQRQEAANRGDAEREPTCALLALDHAAEHARRRCRHERPASRRRGRRRSRPRARRRAAP